MNPIERVMRVMTHLNIGLALGMVAWIAGSGVLVVSGELPVRRSVPVPAMPATVDQPAPWSIDADGRVHLRSD